MSFGATFEQVERIFQDHPKRKMYVDYLEVMFSRFANFGPKKFLTLVPRSRTDQ